MNSRLLLHAAMLVVVVAACAQRLSGADAGTLTIDGRDFTQTMSAPGTTTAGVPSAPQHGVGRVIPVTLPGTVVVERAARMPPGATLATLSVRVPGDFPVDGRVSLPLKDKDGLWFESHSVDPVTPGLWQDLRFPVTIGHPDVRPVGHSAVWDDYHAGRVAAIGVQISGNGSWTGAIEIRRLLLSGDAAPAPAGRPWLRQLTQTSAGPARAYRVFELSFLPSFAVANPCDPDELAIEGVFTDASGKTWVVPAFYDQPQRRELGRDLVEVLQEQGRGSWRVRFTPLGSGEHYWSLRARHRGRALGTARHGFDVLPGDAHGFVGPSAKDPRFLESADGAFFYPIGQNIHAPFDRLSARILKVPVLPHRGTFAYDDYFAKMAANGENTVVVWMCNWWLSIEWNRTWKGFGGLNDYHLGNAWRLDYVLDAAARKNIQVMLVLDNHGKYSRYVDGEWSSSPYNKDNGGPCASPEDFFAGKSSLPIYAKLIRYIAGRWGGHPNLLCYVLISELNLVGSSAEFHDHPDRASWLQRVCNEFDAVDAYRRPRAIQFSHDHRAIDPVIAKLPGIGIVLGNAYRQSGSLIPLVLGTSRLDVSRLKPNMIIEYGGSWEGTTPARLHADLHTAMWANAMTPSPGAPMSWWFDIIDRRNLYGEFLSLSRFMAHEDRRGLELRTVELKPLSGSSAEQVEALALIGKRMARLWIYDRASTTLLPRPELAQTHAGIVLAVPGLDRGRYRLGFWDTREGRETSVTHADCHQGVLRFTAADFAIDCAIKIDWADDR